MPNKHPADKAKAGMHFALITWRKNIGANTIKWATSRNLISNFLFFRSYTLKIILILPS